MFCEYSQKILTWESKIGKLDVNKIIEAVFCRYFNKEEESAVAVDVIQLQAFVQNCFVMRFSYAALHACLSN